MKLLLCSLMLLASIASTHAQGGLFDKLKKKAKEKTEQKIENTIDKTIDKGIEKIEEKALGKKKEKKEKKSSESTSKKEPKTSTTPIEISTPEGIAFQQNKITITDLLIDEMLFEFVPNPNKILDDIGLTLLKELQTKKLEITIYKNKASDEHQEKIFMMLKSYWVNKFELVEDFIHWKETNLVKAGANRTIELLLIERD